MVTTLSCVLAPGPEVAALAAGMVGPSMEQNLGEFQYSLPRLIWWYLICWLCCAACQQPLGKGQDGKTAMAAVSTTLFQSTPACGHLHVVLA